MVNETSNKLTMPPARASLQPGVQFNRIEYYPSTQL